MFILILKECNGVEFMRFFGSMGIVGTALVASKLGAKINLELLQNTQAIGTAVGVAGTNQK